MLFLFFLFFPVQLTNIPIDSQAGVCGYRFTSAVSGDLSVDENERVEVVDNQQSKESCIQKVNTLTTLNGVQQLPERFYIVIGSFQQNEWLNDLCQNCLPYSVLLLLCFLKTDIV